MLNSELCNIQTYNDLKNIFSQFAMLCEETLLEENHLIISYEYEQDITINLSVLGQPLEIFFSMARTDQDETFGKLNFTRVNGLNKRESIWTLYFDREGNTRYSPYGANRVYNINNKNSIRIIFVHLLALYVRKNKLSYLYGNEESLVNKFC
jgi:hypothetical protein